MHVARKKLALIATFVVLAIGASLVVPLALSSAKVGAVSASTAATSARNRFTNIPVRGTFGSAGTFVGTLDISRFTASNGQLVAVGKLSGVAKRSTGAIAGAVINRAVEVPVAQVGGRTCEILRLVLGPLDLNLLGLHVHLNRVILVIEAHEGPGNLLGNLLCAIAHLLDRPPVPNSVMKNLLTAVVRTVGAQKSLT